MQTTENMNIFQDITNSRLINSDHVFEKNNLITKSKSKKQKLGFKKKRNNNKENVMNKR